MRKLESFIGKYLKVEIKAIDTEAKTVTAVISHIKGDRDGDVIPPSSMKKRLSSYKAHPILLQNHSYKNEDVIGQTKSIKLNDDNVEAKLEYFAGKQNADGSPMNKNADWAWELAQKGLGAYSIGFKAHDFEWIKEDMKDGDNTYTNYVGRNFKDIELLEISHVVVPANSNALQMAIDNSETDPEQRELCELVLKGLKSGEIKGPNITPKPEGGESEFDIPVPTNVKDLVAKLKELKILKDANGDDEANMQAQFDLMNKRIAAVEVLASQCQSQYLQLQGMIEDIQDDVQGLLDAQETSTLGPSGTDVNEDPANPTGTPGKGFHHYSHALFGKPGSEKTKQLPQESAVITKNRLKVLVKN